MTPRTRSSNRDADYKVYYSKKVPQQVHFPHKRKIVRRPSSPVRDDGKRQMIFLPEKMKRRSTPVVADSDDDSDQDTAEGLEEGGVPIELKMEEKDEQHSTKKTKGKGKRRSSDVMPQDSNEDEGPVEPTSKRRRTAVSPKNHRRSKRVTTDANDENHAAGIRTNRERTIRRQSTMTQLVDGRKPLPEANEPNFKPVKQTSRLSWGRGKSENDRKQRTLTQMIPGMRPQEIMSDEDVDEALSDNEAEQRDSQTYGDAVAQRLAQQGLHRVEVNGFKKRNAADDDVEDVQRDLEDNEIKKEFIAGSQDTPDVVLQSVEDEVHKDCEDSYKPTQFIKAPVKGTTRVIRCGNQPQSTETGEAFYQPQRQVRTRKARFSLLSTPEKRRIREIPSSQSPADSPLSTQVSPQKLQRSPLKMCSSNPILSSETPSKRKQVTFNMPSKTPIPPPTLRKFESTIQDSEDEDEGLIEEDLLAGKRRKDEDAQPLFSRPEAAFGKPVGADTQAILDRIDQACANGNEEDDMDESGSSQESNNLPTLRGHNGPSPELGEPHKSSNGRSSSHSIESVTVKQEPGYDNDEDDNEDEDEDATILPIAPSNVPNEVKPIASDATTSTEGDLPLQTEQLRSTPPVIEGYTQYTCPFTPMVINDDSSDEENYTPPNPTPPRSSRRQLPPPPSTSIQQSADLDSEAIQVPCSPDHETQGSHSSKAEQQLQNEWLSYSQYVHTCPPHSSSTRVAPDAFSYNATPRPPRETQTTAPHAHQQQPSTYHPSQATTVDEITQRTHTAPRNKSTQYFGSTHTTPHCIPSSQPAPLSSPSKPPPLFIPSSFPSPEKAWGGSSQLLDGGVGITQATGVGSGWGKSSQWASLEDFSIPAMPPGVDVEDE
ncbi:hypothetical protein G6011_06019 [Alternaria panax]|uniref:Uncharacterized protein n=1 Tax=Alternaria panax TaxID=48097 RepID=A0AAD4FI61_9PLEO|nr:hypothetical protein G6011_06019 [Alternaria panax]